MSEQEAGDVLRRAEAERAREAVTRYAGAVIETLAGDFPDLGTPRR